jgi:hypothetical protein
MTLATDVYGLGAIFYALLTGKAPFGGDSVIETIDAVRHRPPDPPTKRNATIPRYLELICLKCLEKNPADRYPTAESLADDLRRWTAGEPVSVRAAGAVERVAKWARRKPTLAAAYALGILTLLFGGLGGAGVWQWRVAARARDVASTAKAVAEQARDGEATARAATEKALEGEAKARATAEQLGEKVARLEYGRSMEVAHQEWREANIGTTLAVLEGTRADLRGWEWRYVQRLCHSELLTIKGNRGPISSASFSPDGAWVVTASFDGTAKVWDARSGALALTCKGHTGQVRSASFSSDGTQIVTASYDKTAKVWDARSGALVITLQGHANPVTSATLNHDGSRIVTGSWDSTAKIWDAKTGAGLLTLKGHTGQVHSASFSSDNTRVVTGSGDSTAKVWDAQSGAPVLTIRGHAGGVSMASFSPDSSRIITCDALMARGWDAQSGVEVLTLRGHTNWVSAASFSPDGSRILTASFDKTARVWDSTAFEQSE